LNLLRFICDWLLNWSLRDIVTLKQKVDWENAKPQPHTHKPLLDCESEVAVNFESNASKSKQKNLKAKDADDNYKEQIIFCNAREDV
jgi:hypothetical protein